jgi:creatinine amidohydrolase
MPQEIRRPWLLEELRQADFRDALPEVAVLPIGALEPHNLHLPLGQDLLHTTWVARYACQQAYQRGAKVVCLPCLPFGVDCNLQAFPIAIHLSQKTLDAVLEEVVDSLLHYGIRKIVLLNGHGGNDFKPFVRQKQCERDVYLFLCDWWKVGQDRYDDIFDASDDHAGEMETSVALFLYPHLVDQSLAGEAAVPPFRFEALNRGWVQTSRNFGRMNRECGAGDPSRATAEKGKQYLELVCQRIADFLVQLSRSPLDPAFPFLADAD